MRGSAYRGISYPPVLGWRLVRWLWRRWCCPRDWHTFDEVESWGTSPPEHSLYCDACGLTVYIECILEEEEDCRRVRAGEPLPEIPAVVGPPAEPLRLTIDEED